MSKTQDTNDYYSFAQFTSKIDRSGILYNKSPKDSLSIPFSQIQTINYSSNIQTGEAYTYKSQHSCSFTATFYFSGISILKPGTSNAKASISNAKARTSNAKASISNDEASISNAEARISNAKARTSNAKASISNDEASISNAEASISNAEARISNDEASISNDGAIVPFDRSILSNNGVYLPRNESNISFTLPIRFKAERSKSLNSGITAITKHLTVELNITFNIKLFNYLIYG